MNPRQCEVRCGRFGSEQARRVRWKTPVGGAAIAAALTIAASSAAVELRGFPVRLPGKIDASSPAVADIDGDGRPEIAICAGAQLVVLDANGAPLAGFPIELVAAQEDGSTRNPSSPALCDIDGDGKREIVASGPDGRLHALNAAGAELPGWPHSLGAAASAGPSCADVNGDGKLDVVITTDDGRLLALFGNGSPVATFKPKGFKVSAALVTVVDLLPDRRGDELAIGGADGSFYALDGSGQVLPGFPLRTDYAISGGAAAGDVDGDGAWDLVFGSQDFGIYAVRSTGQPLAGFPVKTGYRIYGGVALGDLDRDGTTDIVVGSGDGKLLALRGNGKALPGWPVDTRARIYSTPALADLNHDGQLEVLVTVSDGQLYAFKSDGKPLPGFPIAIGGNLKTSPQVVDLDGNGAFEVLVAAGAGEVHAFNFAVAGGLKQAELAWPGYGHDAERAGRTRPNRAAFLGIQLQPAQPRAGDALTCGYQYRDLDSDAESGTRVRWFRDGKRVAELDDQKQLPPRTAKKGERWHCAVQEGADFEQYGDAAGSHVVAGVPVRLVNTPPGAPEVVFVDAPRARAPLKLQIKQPAIDDDGDKVSYRVRWLHERTPVPASSTPFEVPAALLRKGQNWEALVVPFDGEAEGAPARVAAVVRNTPPDPPQIALNPREPRAGDQVSVRIEKPALDPDGDGVSYEYEWSVDGTARPLARSESALAAIVAGKGHRIGVEVVAFDGEDRAPAVKAEVTVGNTPPPAPQLELLPARPRSGEPVALKIGALSADVDGDPVSHAVVWNRNGTVVAGWTGAWVERGQLKKGERYLVKVTPSDGSGAGLPAQLEFTVGNTAPGAARPAIAPAQPRAGESLSAQLAAPANDRDGDKLSYSWQWLRNGAPVAGLTSSTVPAGQTRKNEIWRAQVTASDGSENGPAALTEVRIGDTRPGPPEIELLPAKRTTAETLRVELRKPAVDVDGDAVSYRYTWLRNGVAQELPDSTTALKPGTVRRDEVWSALVVAVADGVESSPASIQFTIGNLPPAAPKIQIVPRTPRTDDDLIAVLPELPIDPDADAVTVSVAWLRNGQPAAVTGLRVPASETRRGEVWTAVAVASDGAMQSAPGKAEVPIENTPPRPPRAVIDRRPRGVDDSVVVQLERPASDADGDQVTLRYQWERNGKPVELPAGTTTLPAKTAHKGEQWAVNIVPNDGTVDGAALRIPFVVVNTPPGAPAIALAPPQPTAVDPLELRVVTPASDADGDRLVYRQRWFKDGVAQNLDPATARIEPKQIHRGQRWQVEVRAFDGTVEGPPASAEVVVGNSGPGAAELALRPATPRGGNALTCEVVKPAADADSDPISYRFAWQRDGAAVAFGADGVVVGSLVHAGQRWSCSAEASDGELIGPVASAAPISIGNAPPPTPKIAIAPAQPTAADALVCAVAAEVADPDGDPVQYRFEWTKGKSAEVLSTQSVVPVGSAKKGETWNCRVRTSDGAQVGEPVTTQVKITNAPPQPPQVKLTPERPLARIDNLRCEVVAPAIDPDGDTVRYRVIWTKDGIEQNFSDQALEVAARNVEEKSVWQCTVQAADGQAASASARSNSVLVLPGAAVAPR